MSNKKVLVTMTEKMLKDIDKYVEQGMYTSRSDFVVESIRLSLYRLAVNLKEIQS